MINEGYQRNFETLCRAINNNDVALLECTDAQSGETVIAIVALNREENGDVSFAPLAKMFNGNPYDELVPPSVPKQ